jgi:hypothetical protein
MIYRLSDEELEELMECRDYVLTPQEVEMCIKKGAAREEIKTGRSVHDWMPRDGRKQHIEGFMSEYAVSRYLMLPCDFSTSLSGDKNGPDIFGAPYSVQVKCVSYDPPYLKFNSLDNFAQDIAVLCTRPQENTIRMHGWISKARFSRNCFKKDYGHGERLCVGVEQLQAMPLLLVLFSNEWRRQHIQADRSGAA